LQTKIESAWPAPATASTRISMAADTKTDGGEEVKLDENRSLYRLSDDQLGMLLSLEVGGDVDSLRFQSSVRRQLCERGYVEVVRKFHTITIVACFGGQIRIQLR
jgi:hypothetical protein